MADIVIPQTQNYILGAWSSYWAVGQSFTAVSSNLQSVTFSVDIVNPYYYYYNSNVQDVPFRAVVVNLADNRVVFTSEQKMIHRLPNENNNNYYWYYSQDELRDVTVSLGDVGVTEGGNYAVFIQFDLNNTSGTNYLAFAASWENPYAQGSGVYTDSAGLNDGFANYIYNYSNIDYKMTLKGGVSNMAPVAVADTANAQEDGAAVTINVLANDTDVNPNDTKSLVSVNAANIVGAVAMNADGTVSYNPGTAFQSLRAGATATETFSYTMRDKAGLTSSANVTVTVIGVNDAPVAANDVASVAEDAKVIIDVLANDVDVDAGDVLSIVSATTASGATVAIVDGKLAYTADADAQDALVLGTSSVDTITYVMSDKAGAQSTASVSVTVNGVANGADVKGTNKSETLNGTALDESLIGDNGDDVIYGKDGADLLNGGNGSDTLYGDAGRDALFGMNGTDVLDGGAGNDFLEGGEGKDTFVFTGSFGHDIVTDFKSQNDTIKISNALAANFNAVMSLAVEQTTGSGSMVIINIDANNSIALVGVTLADLSAKDFIFG